MNAQQLKNAILQEAIEGRLVPQDPNDEPASALLARIRKEKEQLVKAGKLKKKDLEVKPISEDEIPFEIPESWEWVRMGDITEIARGGSPRPIKEYLTDAPNGLNWIKIGDTDKGGKYINSCKEKIKPEGLKKTRMVHPGDFLLTNSMSFGRPYITNIEGCIHDGWLMISPYAGVFDQSFLFYVLSSAFAHKQFSNKVAGAVVQNLNSDKVADSYVPIPPLVEQHRIVAKIEELLPKVEEYGKAQDALNKLNAELPERLKKSFLQEAIEGHLVPQDPNDEPASVLLDKIRKEKEQLVKAGKLKKKDLVVTPISEDEIPYEIPDSWEWVRFGTITINRDSERVPLSVDERSKLKKIYDYYGASGVIDKVEKYLFDKPLLLIGEDGANLINRSTPIAFIAKGKYWVNNHAHVLDYINEDLMQYMCWYINAISLVDYVTGTAQPKMNQEKMNSILVALPPLAEQHRIVEKLEQVLGEIDKLKK